MIGTFVAIAVVAAFCYILYRMIFGKKEYPKTTAVKTTTKPTTPINKPSTPAEKPADTGNGKANTDHPDHPDHPVTPAEEKKN